MSYKKLCDLMCVYCSTVFQHMLVVIYYILFNFSNVNRCGKVNIYVRRRVRMHVYWVIYIYITEYIMLLYNFYVIIKTIWRDKRLH